MPVDVIILAGGRSTRMHSNIPKALHKLAGKPIIEHVLSKVPKGSNIILIASDHLQSKLQHPCGIIQHTQDGTGGAIQLAMKHLKHQRSLVLYGDMPLISNDTIKNLLSNEHVINLAITKTFGTNGRVVLDQDGYVNNVVEFNEAKPDELLLQYCNAGAMSFDNQITCLFERLTLHNEEKYLTDIFAIAAATGIKTKPYMLPYEECIGINTMEDLALCESTLQRILRQKHMRNGVSLIDPSTVFIAHDTVIGKDTIIEPNVYIGNNVRIGENVLIRAFSYIENCIIENCCTIGPFARIREQSFIKSAAKIGNFTEIKKSVVGEKTKINHLSYIGDAFIGMNCNIGAGTIFCNYDGYNKHTSHIGDNAFIGSNTCIISPVNIDTNCIIGAGSLVSCNLEKDSLAFLDSNLIIKTNGSIRYKNRKQNRSSSKDT